MKNPLWSDEIKKLSDNVKLIRQNLEGRRLHINGGSGILLTQNAEGLKRQTGKIFNDYVYPKHMGRKRGQDA